MRTDNRAASGVPAITIDEPVELLKLARAATSTSTVRLRRSTMTVPMSIIA